MTLEDYIRSEYAEGKIDFAFRATVFEGSVKIYIHPLNRDGNTTPTVEVKGDVIVWPEGWTILES